MSYSNKEVFTLSSVSVILCECFYNLVCIFVDTFLIARILSVTDYNIFYIGLFYLIQYAVLLVLSVLLNYLRKKIKLNYFVTIGAVIMIALVMSVYFLNDTDLITFLPLLAVVYAFGSCFFWTGQNNLATMAVSSRYQVRFFTVKKTAVIAVKAIVPFILGSSISAMGFNVVAIIMIVFTVLLFISSLFIKPNKEIHLKYKFFSYVKTIFKESRNYKILWTNYLSAFFYGLSITTLSVLFTYMVYVESKSDFSLGLIKSIVTAVSLLGMFSFLKTYRKKQAGLYTFIPMILVPLTGIIMIFCQNITTIIIFFSTYNVLSVNLTGLSEMRRAGVIRMLDMHEHTLEHNSFYEIMLAFARVVGFGIFVITGLVGTEWMLKVCLGINILAFIVYCLLIYRMEKLLIEQGKTWKKDHLATQPIQNH